MSRWEHRDKNHSKYKHTKFGLILIIVYVTVMMVVVYFFQNDLGEPTITNFLLLTYFLSYLGFLILPLKYKIRYISKLRYS